MSESPATTGPKIVKPVTRGRPKAGSSVAQRPQRKPNAKVMRGSNSKEKGDMPPGAALSITATSPTVEKDTIASPPTTLNEQIPLHGKSSTPPPIETPQATTDTVSQLHEPEILEDAEVIKEKEKLKLEDVRRRQKEMEEKNKKKKTILSKAIAERKKKAFAESTKLIRIQSELGKLDDMLNYDVSILRDKIDTACYEYNAAQKRFERAETEYIESKMNLHKATEMKEDLTEHLYKLIQLNEERKANKLEDLMQKLELEEIEDVNEPDAAQPSIETQNSENIKSEKPRSESDAVPDVEQKVIPLSGTEEKKDKSEESVQ